MATKHKLNPERWAVKFLKRLAMNGFSITLRELVGVEKTWLSYSGCTARGYWVKCGRVVKYGIMYIEHGSHATFWVGDGPLNVNGREPGEKQWSHDITANDVPPTPLDLLLGETNV